MVRMMTDRVTFETLERDRFYLGLSRRDMAEILGVTRQTYYNWSKGGVIKQLHRVAARVEHVVDLAILYEIANEAPKLPNSKDRKLWLLAILNER
jgi:DNA-binding XRE family transcriptional regulator